MLFKLIKMFLSYDNTQEHMYPVHSSGLLSPRNAAQTCWHFDRSEVFLFIDHVGILFHFGCVKLKFAFKISIKCK